MYELDITVAPSKAIENAQNIGDIKAFHIRCNDMQASACKYMDTSSCETLPRNENEAEDRRALSDNTTARGYIVLNLFNDDVEAAPLCNWQVIDVTVRIKV